MQVFISRSRPSLLFLTMSGSARNGRAIETRSALPLPSIDSTVDGALILFVAQSGTDTTFSSRSFFVTNEKAPLGTLVAMVAIEDECRDAVGAWTKGGKGRVTGSVKKRRRQKKQRLVQGTEDDGQSNELYNNNKTHVSSPRAIRSRC